MDDYANVDAPPAPQDPHPSSNGEQMENGGGGELPSSLGFVPRDGVPGYGRDDEEGAVGGERGDESIISGSQSAEGGNNLYLRPAFFGNLAHACLATDIESLFLNPPPPPGASSDFVRQPFALDRVVSPIRVLGNASMEVIFLLNAHFLNISSSPSPPAGHQTGLLLRLLQGRSEHGRETPDRGLRR